MPQIPHAVEVCAPLHALLICLFMSPISALEFYPSFLFPSIWQLM